MADTDSESDSDCDKMADRPVLHCSIIYFPTMSSKKAPKKVQKLHFINHLEN